MTLARCLALFDNLSVAENLLLAWSCDGQRFWVPVAFFVTGK